MTIVNACIENGCNEPRVRVGNKTFRRCAKHHEARKAARKAARHASKKGLSPQTPHAPVQLPPPVVVIHAIDWKKNRITSYAVHRCAEFDMPATDGELTALLDERRKRGDLICEVTHVRQYER